MKDTPLQPLQVVGTKMGHYGSKFEASNLMEKI